MSRFFPDSAAVLAVRDALAADPRFGWESALVAQHLAEPGPGDVSGLVAEFLALADGLRLSTGDLPFWVALVPFTEDGVTSQRVVAIMPGTGALVHGGQHPRANEPLSAADFAANPSLAKALAAELNSRLVHCRTAAP